MSPAAQPAPYDNLPTSRCMGGGCEGEDTFGKINILNPKVFQNVLFHLPAVKTLAQTLDVSPAETGGGIQAVCIPALPHSLCSACHKLLNAQAVGQRNPYTKRTCHGCCC